MNNQPFLRAARVSLDLRVRHKARAYLEHLHAALQAADFLEGEAALMALAAFLRARIDEVPIPPDWVATREHSLVSIAQTMTEVHRAHSEGGKVGQALTCAALDAFFADVRTRRINDPSNKSPDDVGVWHKGRLIAAGEVRQRPFAEHEARQFATRLRREGVHRGFVAALDQSSTALNWAKIVSDAYDRHGVLVRAYFGVDALLFDAAFFGPVVNPHDVSGRIPEHGYSRLIEFEVSRGCL